MLQSSIWLKVILDIKLQYYLPIDFPIFFCIVHICSKKALKKKKKKGFGLVFSATFNNISVISWRTILICWGNRSTLENHLPVASHWQTLSHNVVSSTPLHVREWNSQRQWWYALIAQVFVNLTTMRWRPRRPRIPKGCWAVLSNLVYTPENSTQQC